MPCCDDGAAPALRAALADLRGLHAPPDTGGLDLAVLAAIALGLALAALAVAARRLMSRQSTPVRRAALADLAAARGLDPPARLFAQARLVARLARALGAEDGMGGRSPEDRAVALDRLLRTDFFTAGPGRALTRDLYAPAAPDLDAVDAGLTQLLSRIRA